MAGKILNSEQVLKAPENWPGGKTSPHEASGEQVRRWLHVRGCISWGCQGSWEGDRFMNGPRSLQPSKDGGSKVAEAPKGWTSKRNKPVFARTATRLWVTCLEKKTWPWPGPQRSEITSAPRHLQQQQQKKKTEKNYPQKGKIISVFLQINCQAHRPAHDYEGSVTGERAELAQPQDSRSGNKQTKLRSKCTR